MSLDLPVSNFLPMIVREVPPAQGPLWGLTPSSEGSCSHTEQGVTILFTFLAHHTENINVLSCHYSSD